MENGFCIIDLHLYSAVLIPKNLPPPQFLSVAENSYLSFRPACVLFLSGCLWVRLNWQESFLFWTLLCSASFMHHDIHDQVPEALLGPQDQAEQGLEEEKKRDDPKKSISKRGKNVLTFMRNFSWSGLF